MAQAPFAALSDMAALLAPISPIGHDVTGEAEQVAAATAGRVFVEVQHAGAVGTPRVWLGFGADPVIGAGLFLDPGGYFSAWTSSEVRAMTQDGSTVRITGMEWGLSA